MNRQRVGQGKTETLTFTCKSSRRLLLNTIIELEAQNTGEIKSLSRVVGEILDLALELGNATMTQFVSRRAIKYGVGQVNKWQDVNVPDRIRTITQLLIDYRRGALQPRSSSEITEETREFLDLVIELEDMSLTQFVSEQAVKRGIGSASRWQDVSVPNRIRTVTQILGDYKKEHCKNHE